MGIISDIVEYIDYYLIILFLYIIGMVVSYFRSATHYIKKHKTDPIYKVKLNSNLTTYFTVLLTIITLIIFIKTSIATILFLIRECQLTERQKPKKIIIKKKKISF